MLCSDECLAHSSGPGGPYAKNSFCQDGSEGAIGASCAYGTDCTDCGPRYMSPPPPSPPTPPPPPRVQGIQRNIAAATLTAGLTCITKYSEPYSDSTSTSEVKQYSIGASPYAYVVLGARYGASGNFKLAAMGEYDAVFAATYSRYTAYYNSGTYWYHHSAHSMGFAPSSSIRLYSYNYNYYGSRYTYTDTSGHYDTSTRMSWRFYSGGSRDYSRDRAGYVGDSTSGLYKVVMYCN